MGQMLAVSYNSSAEILRISAALEVSDASVTCAPPLSSGNAGMCIILPLIKNGEPLRHSEAATSWKQLRAAVHLKAHVHKYKLVTTRDLIKRRALSVILVSHPHTHCRREHELSGKKLRSSFAFFS
ncbi:hypothetical protein AGOR_G00144510 [Albula goreensis]|uniref:Uncharacterized protein n=1 Tax=Albula goreensis TaxID=1534307 RepID=A0A8T3D5C8_9TELE|nr:hypothetical protein AGOR_G00144510 [Albula goreensis]